MSFASLVDRARPVVDRVRAVLGEPAGEPFGPRTVRWTDRVVDVTALRFIVWVAIAVWVWQGVLTDPFKLADWMDDHQFYAWEQADRMTLLKWGELPVWNPFWCGGTVALSAPEDSFLSPDFLLRLIWGVAHGRRLATMLLLVLGFEGTFRLCRRLDASTVGAGFAAVVFGTCERFVSFIHDGWVNFLGFELMPWVLLAVINGLSSFRWRLVGAFFFAWIVLAAGTYPTPFTLLAMAYVTAALSVRALFVGKRWDWLRPWLASATIGVFALLLASGKLIPTLVFLRQFPRVFEIVEKHQALEVFAQLWARYDFVVIAALVAALFADVAGGIFLGGAMLFFALAMGDFGESSPFHLLKQLPLFSQLRFPDRYMVLILLFTSIAASRGITRVEDALPKLFARGWAAFRAWRTRLPAEMPRPLAWIAVALATYAAYDFVRPRAELILTGVEIRPHAMYIQEGPRRYEAPFKQSRGNRRDAHIFPAASMGSIYCVSGNPIPQSHLLRGDLPAEEYPVDPNVATVKRLAWSPNAIDLEVDAKAPTTIHVNQNWSPHWKSDVGVARSDDRLLAVDVPAGKNVVHLRYRDGLQTFSLLLSAATLLFMIVVAARFVRAWGRATWKDFKAMPTWPDEVAAEQEKQAESDAAG